MLHPVEKREARRDAKQREQRVAACRREAAERAGHPSFSWELRLPKLRFSSEGAAACKGKKEKKAIMNWLVHLRSKTGKLHSATPVGRDGSR